MTPCQEVIHTETAVEQVDFLQVLVFPGIKVGFNDTVKEEWGQGEPKQGPRKTECLHRLHTSGTLTHPSPPLVSGPAKKP